MGYFEHPALVAFYPEEVISAQLLGDEPRALLLAVHRVGGNEGSGGRPHFFEQRLERGNFVALVLNGNLPQGQAQVVILVTSGRFFSSAFARPSKTCSYNTYGG